jgi:hypothetical protein
MLRNEFWSDGEVEGQERKHIAHCFDYLRQAIMCAGDMTLEWANWKGKEPRIDGWGMKHRGCRIWVSLVLFGASTQEKRVRRWLKR